MVQAGIYSKTAFANEIAGAVALHPKLKWLYAHHPHGLGEELTKTVIDTVALTSICMLAVESYKKNKDDKDALATGLGTLVVAFIVPNLLLGKTVEVICKGGKCSSGGKVAVALVLVGVLYKLEEPVVKQLRKMLGKLKKP